MNQETEANPYQSPSAEDEPEEPEAKWVQTDPRRVMTPPRSTLPARCFYCNDPTSETRTLSKAWWMSWSGAVSIKVKWFVCPYHHRQLRRAHAFGALSGLGIAGFYIAIAFSSSRVPGGFLSDNLFWIIVLISIIWAVSHYLQQNKTYRKPELPRIVRANPRKVLIANAGKPFLDSLHDDQGEVYAV